jgi:arylsulfatase A-like enzyme
MARKPNILILWGDDIGYWNVSAHKQKNTEASGFGQRSIEEIASRTLPKVSA